MLNRRLRRIYLAFGPCLRYDNCQEVMDMQLMIKQRVFSWTDSYDVYDADGNAKYFVKGDFFSLGHRIRVFDKATGAELGCVAQRLLTLLPAFDITVGDRIVGTVRRRFTLFTQEYEVDYRGWDVAGDFLGWEYTVTEGSRDVMSISKQWLTWGDTYILSYDRSDDELAGLLLVIAVDAANCTHND